MNNEDLTVNEQELSIVSAQREVLRGWVIERFQSLMATDCVDSALYFADEWFEWLNPDLLNTESTLFYNEDELQELYESCKE